MSSGLEVAAAAAASTNNVMTLQRKTRGNTMNCSIFFRLHILSFVISIFLFIIRLTSVESDLEDPILKCGVCMALVEELNWATGITDKRKKLQIGSFRLDAHGDTNPTEILLATSEAHQIEIHEKICLEMWHYAKYIGYNGNTAYIRTKSRSNTNISMNHAEVAQEIRDDLLFACDAILEEYDEWMIPYYKAEDQDICEKLCVHKAGLCNEQNVSDYMFFYGSAVMEGMKELDAADEEAAMAAEKKHFKKRWGLQEEEEEEEEEDEDEEEEIIADPGEEKKDGGQKENDDADLTSKEEL